MWTDISRFLVVSRDLHRSAPFTLCQNVNFLGDDGGFHWVVRCLLFPWMMKMLLVFFGGLCSFLMFALRLHFFYYIGLARSFSASYCAWLAGLSPQQHGTLWVSMLRSLAPAAHQWWGDLCLRMVGGVWGGVPETTRSCRYVEWRTSAPGSFNIFLFLSHSLSLSFSDSDACRVRHDEACAKQVSKAKDFLILSDRCHVLQLHWWLVARNHSPRISDR